MLDSLEWRSLEQRRIEYAQDFTMCYYFFMLKDWTVAIFVSAEVSANGDFPYKAILENDNQSILIVNI